MGLAAEFKFGRASYPPQARKGLPMKFCIAPALRRLFALVFVFAALAAPALRAQDAAAPVVEQPAVTAPVTVTDNGNTWTLDNGIVKARDQQTHRQCIVPDLQGHRDAWATASGLGHLGAGPFRRRRQWAA